MGGDPSNVNNESVPRPYKFPRPQRRNWIAPLVLLAPMGLFLGILIVASLMILRLSFGQRGAEETWTLQNYMALGQDLYLHSIFVTFKLALLSTAIVVILGFPIAMFLVHTRSNLLRRLIMFVLLLPLLMNLLLQSYGWMIILGPNGLINHYLKSLGLIDRPILLMYNEIGVLMGLVQMSFPLAVLPIASALRGIPPSLEQAATTLGANRLKVWRHIVLPLSLPGVIAGSLLVFGWTASAFVIPFLLGGGRVTMLAVLIRNQMGPFLDWPFGSANAVVLIVITMVVQLTYQRMTTKYLA